MIIMTGLNKKQFGYTINKQLKFPSHCGFSHSSLRITQKNAPKFVTADQAVTIVLISRNRMRNLQEPKSEHANYANSTVDVPFESLEQSIAVGSLTRSPHLMVYLGL